MERQQLKKHRVTLTVDPICWDRLGYHSNRVGETRAYMVRQLMRLYVDGDLDALMPWHMKVGQFDKSWEEG